jgi:coenzyme F420 hydrogenase subunit beta
VKAYRIREEMNGVAEPPGKTWFWELQAGVIDADRCIQCGTCVAVCPSNSIGIDEDTDLPELVKMCTGCSLCWDFCPRGGLRYEALWPPSTVTGDAVDGGVNEAGPVVRADAADNYWKITGGPPGDGLGAVMDSYAVRAGARPDDAQDGGVVSALLIAALAGGEIDGALVTRPSDDPDEPWKGVAHLATTAQEIIDAAGSYYNQTMALAELDLSKYDLPAKPRIAVVGTPCEIQGIRAMQSRRWPTGAHRIDAVVLTIALLCTKSFDYQGLMLQLLQKDRGIDLERVSKVDVIRGSVPTSWAGVRTSRSGAWAPWTGGAACWCGPSGEGRPWTTPAAASTSVSSTIPRPWSSWTPSTSGSPSTASAVRSTPTPRCSSTMPTM